MRYLVGFWNLENLFAPEGFAGRPDWLEQSVGSDLEGWTEALFHKKVAQLASVVTQLKGGAGPDLLGVCEVENRFALQALANAMNAPLQDRDYQLVHVDADRDQRGIDTAFIYDKNVLVVDPETIYSHFVMRRTGTRDITQATFATQSGNELIALSNHWPSRSGGHPVESQGFRMTAGETLAYWHERIRQEKGKDVAVLAMGDLNDEPADQSVVVHANASRERDDIQKSTSARFYNLAWNYLRQPAKSKSNKDRILYGTMYFDNNGFVFDQFLASRSLLGGGKLTVDEGTARIEAFPEMVSDSKSYGPIRFGLPKGDVAKNIDQNGFSDHFPVSIEVVEADED